MTDAAERHSFVDTSSATLVGRFTWRPATDTWHWSDGMYAIHGFEPHEVVPTTDLVLSHLHPDDLDSAMESQAQILADGTPFTFPHRLFNARGQERIVIAAGHLDRDADGAVVIGHLVDVTDFRKDAVAAELDQAVQDFNAHRAVIEQAKGVLMQIYSVDAGTAWQILRAYSQSHNRRLREIAEVLAAAAAADLTPSKDRRGVRIDEMLTDLDTAHSG